MWMRLRGALPLWAAESHGSHACDCGECAHASLFRAVHTLLDRHRASAALEVIRIEPSEPLGRLRDAVVWSEPLIARWLALGERDGARALRSITSDYNVGLWRCTASNG